LPVSFFIAGRSFELDRKNYPVMQIFIKNLILNPITTLYRSKEKKVLPEKNTFISEKG